MVQHFYKRSNQNFQKNMNKLDVMAKNWVQGVKVGTILNACHYCAQINLRFPPKTAESIDG